MQVLYISAAFLLGVTFYAVFFDGIIKARSSSKAKQKIIKNHVEFWFEMHAGKPHSTLRETFDDVHRRLEALEALPTKKMKGKN